MKIIKNMLLLCLVFVLFCAPVSAYNEDVLNYYEVLPVGVAENEPLTREIMAYALAKILDPEQDYPPVNTEFSDVLEDNPYSGYIQYMADRRIMAGVGDDLFQPEGTVTQIQVSKVLVNVLGYGPLAEARGGYHAGYTSLAASLFLYNGVEVKDNVITCGNFRDLLLNVLETEVPDERLYVDNDEYKLALLESEDGTIYAEKQLGLYEYRAMVGVVDLEDYTVTITFESADRLKKYDKGQRATFEVSKSIDIKQYEHVPVVFVLKDDELIIDMKPQRGVQIYYGVVDTVNNDTKNDPYYTDYLNDLSIAESDEEFSFAENCRFIYNNEFYQGKLDLMGRYVKIVAEEDEILTLSTWDLTDGGLINSIDYNNIYYRKGTAELRMTGIQEYADLTVIIDGESRNISELHAGAMFSYYLDKEEGNFVIVATEKRMTDTLLSIDSNGRNLTLGSVTVDSREEVYSSQDGKIYRKGQEELLTYCNTTVEVIFDVYSKAQYIISATGQTISQSNVVYLTGYRGATGFKKAAFQLFELADPDTILKEYAISDRVCYEGDLTEAEVLGSVGAEDGSALYEVTISSQNEITSFARLRPYDGFGAATTNPSSFIEDGNAAYLNVDGHRLYFTNTTPITCIYKEDGVFKTLQKTYPDLRGGFCSGVTMRFYGYEENSDVRLITLSGNVSAISTSSQYGILTKVASAVDAEGEPCYMVTIDDAAYRVPIAVGKNLRENMLVSYTKGFLDSGIANVDASLALSDDFSDWNGKFIGSISFTGGTIRSADAKRVVLEGDPSVIGDESYYYYRPGKVKFYNIDSYGRIKQVKYQDLQPGLEVMVGIASKEAYLVFTNAD